MRTGRCRRGCPGRRAIPGHLDTGCGYRPGGNWRARLSWGRPAASRQVRKAPRPGRTHTRRPGRARCFPRGPKAAPAKPARPDRPRGEEKISARPENCRQVAYQARNGAPSTSQGGRRRGTPILGSQKVLPEYARHRPEFLKDVGPRCSGLNPVGRARSPSSLCRETSSRSPTRLEPPGQLAKLGVGTAKPRRAQRPA
jgi:hypothetical protein